MLCPCRVLEALWELLLQAILQALGTNLDVSADFYSRFHFTLEVGPCGGAPCAGLQGERLLPSSGPRCPRPRCIGLPSPDSSSSKHPPGHFLPASPPGSAAPALPVKAVPGRRHQHFPKLWGLLLCPWCERWLCPGLPRSWCYANSRLHLSWGSVPSTRHNLTSLPSCSALGPGHFLPRRRTGSAPGEPEGWKLQGEA